MMSPGRMMRMQDGDDFGDSQQPGSVPIVGISALPPMKDQHA